MQIFKQTKEWVKKEKEFTVKILNNLLIIEKEKLYADLKYPSLHKYVVKELGYSDAEATVRVNAVRLMIKSAQAQKGIRRGKISLSNAAEANKAIGFSKDKNLIEEIVKEASTLSTRQFKKKQNERTGKERQEVLVLNELMLKDFDRLRKRYGDLSTYELLRILLEKELRAPIAKQRGRTHKPKNSRFIPKLVKSQVYKGECSSCGVRYGLEYDHKLKHSHGGTNAASNIQVLCRSCNQRKELKLKQLGVFA